MHQKFNLQIIITLAVAAIFPVLFMWGVFDKWVLALGYNVTIYSLILLLLYLTGIKKQVSFLKKNAIWMIPIMLICISFSLFWNTFIKGINLYLLPLILLFFFSLWRTEHLWGAQWSFTIIKNTFFRKVSVKQTFQVLWEYLNAWWNISTVVKKVTLGLIVVLILNVMIIWTLMTADNYFAELIFTIVENLDFMIVVKSFLTIIFFIYLAKLKLSWSEKQIYEYKTTQNKRDSIIAWIVIWWTLITYTVFLMMQLQILTSGVLPQWVEAAARFVKWGFWQLFMLSILNIILFFVYFKKTHSSIQALLFGFVLASIALLLSAAHKMILYIAAYGFSYEKFYALYTVLFFGILFFIMISLLISKKHNDILKITVFLALWMYSLVTVFPTDILIFKHNTKMAMQNDEFSGQYQSHMLSRDIRDSVLELSRIHPETFNNHSWSEWLEKKYRQSSDRKWYEKNRSSY